MADQRTQAILIRVLPEERAAFKRAAKREGLSVAAWLRSKGKLAAEGTPEPEANEDQAAAA